MPGHGEASRATLLDLVNVAVQIGIALLWVERDTLTVTLSEHAHDHILHHAVFMRHELHPIVPLAIADVTEAISHVLCADLQQVGPLLVHLIKLVLPYLIPRTVFPGFLELLIADIVHTLLGSDPPVFHLKL